MSPSDWLSAFSLLCAAFAAWKAAEAVTQARLARREDAEARRAAQLDREWQQLDRIGGLIEEIFVNAMPDRRNVAFSDDQWRAARNRVRQLVAGAEHTLPHCQSVVEAGDRDEVYRRASLARTEVESAMRQTIAQVQGMATIEVD